MSLHRKCCCNPCAHCTATPAVIACVFSGVTLCATGCIETYSGTHWSNISFDLNGTYDLTPDVGNPCRFSGIIGAVNIYGASLCTGLISNGTFNNGGIQLVVEFSASTISITVSFQKLSGGVGTQLFFFSASYNTGSATFDCTASRTINNSLVSGDCGSYMTAGSAIAYGGQIDISS